MGVKTKEEYIESLRQMKPTAYMAGEKITNIVDNPRLRPGIEATGATYELAQMNEYRDLMLTHSPLIDEPVSRFTLPPGSIEDLVARVKINRTLGNWVGTCHQRCTGLDCLSALSWAPAISVAPAWTVCLRFPSSPMTSIRSTIQIILNGLPVF
jgi:4-hydroxybutyryl-CoA dehydratase/vinylacetyl-CoA-Delta-isomerase